MATKARLPETERHWLRVLGTLNEAQARVFVAQKALAEGRGAVSRLARLTHMSRPTILKGIAELETGRLPSRPESGRIRALGGGRKSVEEADPHIKRVLARLVEASTAGDPMSYLLWTNKSTRNLAEELARQGYTVSHVTVARCLRELGYSLQANVKAIEGKQHPDRDAQFRYLNESKFGVLSAAGTPWSAWTRKRRSWLDPLRIAGFAGSRQANRRRSTFMISRPQGGARRSPMGPTT